MHSILLALVVVVLGVTATLSAPLEQRQGNQRRGPETREEQINYLRRFGHWRGPQIDQKGVGDDGLSRSLLAFQNFYGLKATGEFDDNTKELMATPRCGVPDNNEDSSRRKRYSYMVFPAVMKWPMTELTYLIQKYTPDLPKKVTKSDIIEAFKFWSDVSPLTFTESKTNETNIKLAFVPRDHGDVPFDGRGAVLAHGMPFPLGFVHFDEAETWTHGNMTGGNNTNLLWVATHEIGHAIGLNHSDVNSSVMFPNYSYDKSYLDFTLDPDDIEGIQSLYGKPLSTILPPKKNTTGRPTPPIRSSTKRTTPPIPSSTKRTTPPIRSSTKRTTPPIRSSTKRTTPPISSTSPPHNLPLVPKLP